MFKTLQNLLTAVSRDHGGIGKCRGWSLARCRIPPRHSQLASGGFRTAPPPIPYCWLSHTVTMYLRHLGRDNATFLLVTNTGKALAESNGMEWLK